MVRVAGRHCSRVIQTSSGARASRQSKSGHPEGELDGAEWGDSGDAGWRKFFVVSIGDLLAATDRLGPPDTAAHTSHVQPSFYIACSRFLPGTNMKTAAHLMYLHMHHHLKLGFQARPQASSDLRP